MYLPINIKISVPFRLLCAKGSFSLADIKQKALPQNRLNIFFRPSRQVTPVSFILFTASSQHSAKVNFCTFSGVLNLLSEKSKLFIFAASSASNSLLSPHSPSYILLLTAFCLSKTCLPAHGDPVNGWYTADLFCCYVSLIRYIRPPSRHEYFPGLIRCHTVFNRYIWIMLLSPIKIFASIKSRK